MNQPDVLKTLNIFTFLYHFHEVLICLCIQIFPILLCNQALFVVQPTIDFAVEIMRVTHEVNGRLQHFKTHKKWMPLINNQSLVRITPYHEKIQTKLYKKKTKLFQITEKSSLCLLTGLAT